MTYLLSRIEGGVVLPLIQIECLLGVRQSLSPGNSNMSKKVTPLKDLTSVVRETGGKTITIQHGGRG